MNKLDRNIGNVLMLIAEIVTGILLLINPMGFTSGIIIIFGILLIILGICSIVSYFRTEVMEAARESGFAKGLILICGGLLCVFNNLWLSFITFSLAILYGTIILIAGINKLQWMMDMIRQKKKFWYAALISALLSLAFAALILINPFTAAEVLWTFIAVSLIVAAVVDLLTLILSGLNPGSGK